MVGILAGLALCSALASGAFVITNPGTGTFQPYTLPPATTGTPYNVLLTATGGVTPFVWSVSGGILPPGLTLNSSSGTMSGTPTLTGNYPFQIQVADSSATGAVATANFTMTVSAGPLTISSLPPFTATVGSPYAYTLTASGGTTPYTWSIASGSIVPLTLNPSTGVISGTPTTPGTLTFTVQVKDSATTPSVATQALTIAVNCPPLVISTAAALPPGTVGTTYSQTIAASGGCAPYTWSVVSGAVPGLTISLASGTLSGTPTAAASYAPVIQVADSAGNTSPRTFSLTVNPPTLTITTQSPLPGGTAGQPYTQALTAAGGVPPYSWSATGLPAGLTINSSTGTISGTLQAAGTFGIPVTVTDSVPNNKVTQLQLTVALPPVPNISLTGVPSSSNSATQIPVQVTLAQAYPADITGQLSLSFAPTISGANDASISFPGGTTANYTIPAGQTTTSPVSFQTGTLAGTITVSATASAYTQPQTVPSQNVTVSTTAPVISAATTSVSGQNISVTVAGYSPTRDMTTAAFNFTATGNNQLQTSQFGMNVAAPFATWFKDPTINNYGSLFSYTQTFSVTGDPTAVVLQSATLTNSQGASAAFSPGH